ncbi:MAG: FHA domain-containing protein, partial [Coriobacteriia bacterium]|nr:FHA domain-containing protein [Coriobacteriia bacterium]
MIETILLAGRVLLIALLFLFLFAVMRTGVGLVKGQTRGGHWVVRVATGPKDISGLKLAATSPLVVGRAPGADIVIN